jgi:hypothetical protein
MGMYLAVNVIYGVAWGDDAPSAAYPTKNDGVDLVEDGEAVYGGRLVWGSHGYTLGDPDRHLAVCTPYEPSAGQGLYAERVPYSTPTERFEWNQWILEYCDSIGLELGCVPGWLALASFG